MITPVRKITPLLWMTDENAVLVINTLSGDAVEPQALFVGGCVRNALLGLSADDIDIATRLTPDQVMKRLGDAGVKTIPTGIDHGTITAVAGGRSFEVTTLRRDVETDGRHAVVAFTDDWAQDAARRDFTMNTLLADAEGNIYDPTGQGIADLDAGRVVFVGEPAQRIAEDYLRILRFFRFYAIYGRGEPDRDALQACRAAANHIPKLSRERITQEFLKIIAAPEPARILTLMLGNGVLADLPCAGYDGAVLERLDRLQREQGAVHIVTRLITLIEAPEAAEAYLLLSNAQKNAFVAIRTAAAQIGQGSAAEIKKLLYIYGAEIAVQALLLNVARSGARAGGLDLSLVRSWQPPRFPINGEDVLAAGVAAGPAIGETLRSVEQWWIAQDFAPGRDECLAVMREEISKS